MPPLCQVNYGDEHGHTVSTIAVLRSETQRAGDELACRQIDDGCGELDVCVAMHSH